MMSELSIGDICIVKGGKRLPKGHQLLESKTKHPYIRTRDLNDHKINLNDVKYITPETHKEIDKYIVDKGNLIISIVGTVGSCAIITNNLDKANLTENCAKIVPKDSSVDTNFLYYFLISKVGQNEINKNTVGSTQLKLPFYGIKNIKIPSIDEKSQVRIADFLATLDKKIELNQKMNETLEEIAKTLFKSWFIDFDPVRAKAEGRPTGLSKEISDLFPDSFEDSEMGEIPKGWEVKALDEIAEFLNGLALQKYPEDEDYPRYPVLKIAQLRLGSTKSQNVFSSNVPDEYIVRNGDYIFSWSGSLLAKFWLGGDAALNQHLFKVTSQNYPKWFFAGWVEKYLDMFSSVAASKATTMGHIKRSDLKDAKTVVPPIELISSLGEYFSPLREKANLCFLENKTLTEIRDTLLPKLISGELKIPDTENLVEEAGI